MGTLMQAQQSVEEVGTPTRTSWLPRCTCGWHGRASRSQSTANDAAYWHGRTHAKPNSAP